MGSMGCSLGWEAAFYYPGQVSTSRSASQCKANWRDSPHISGAACKPAQQAGRSGRPKIVQRKSVSRCTHGTPAGLFSELIDGAIQQAPQPGRQLIAGRFAINDSMAASAGQPAWSPRLFVGGQRHCPTLSLP